MGKQLPEEKLNRLLPALSLLARRIGAGVTPDQHALKEILLSIGLQGEEWTLQELELWSRKLQQARTVSSDTEKTTIAAELQSRGIPEAPAILAVDAAIPPPLIVEPRSINFGSLKPGEGANATLKVSSKLTQAVVDNNRLRVASRALDSGDNLVKVMLLGGSAGESLQGSVILKSERGELRVPVTAQWEKEPPMLQRCPQCKRESLFWNRYDKKYECLNLDCKVEGPSLDKLVRPQSRHKLY